MYDRVYTRVNQIWYNKFKIEGRMKTAYYVATVVRAYRMAIDEFYRDPENWKFNPMWMEELKKVVIDILHQVFT